MGFWELACLRINPRAQLWNLKDLSWQCCGSRLRKVAIIKEAVCTSLQSRSATASTLRPRAFSVPHKAYFTPNAALKASQVFATERGRHQNALPFASDPVLAPFNDKTEFLCIWGPTGDVYRTVLRCAGHEKERSGIVSGLISKLF